MEQLFMAIATVITSGATAALVIFSMKQTDKFDEEREEATNIGNDKHILVFLVNRNIISKYMLYIFSRKAFNFHFLNENKASNIQEMYRKMNFHDYNASLLFDDKKLREHNYNGVNFVAVKNELVDNHSQLMFNALKPLSDFEILSAAVKSNLYDSKLKQMLDGVYNSKEYNENYENLMSYLIDGAELVCRNDLAYEEFQVFEMSDDQLKMFKRNLKEFPLIKRINEEYISLFKEESDE